MAGTGSILFDADVLSYCLWPDSGFSMHITNVPTVPDLTSTTQ